MGVFFSLLCLLEFSLNDHTLEDVNFDLWRVCGQGLDAVTCLQYFVSFLFSARCAWVLPRCCHSQTQSRNAHISAHDADPPASKTIITISSVLVLFVHVTQSCEGFFFFIIIFLETLGEIALLSALCMFFQKPLERPRLSYQFPVRLIVYSLSFSSYLITTSTCFFPPSSSGVSYHYAVLQKL